MQSTESDRNALPVAVVGAGPVGLAAAAHLLSRGKTPIVLEAGASAGHTIVRWSHVRMFSPWRYNVDSVARTLLLSNGWTPPPDEATPSGKELVTDYLEPLAGLPSIAPHVLYGRRVTAIGKLGFDRLKSRGRERAPFEVRFLEHGSERTVVAQAVIDASGTWQTYNPLGTGGLPAPGEDAARDHVFYRIPDVRGADRHRFAGKRILVAGAGASAFTALVELSLLADHVPGTEVVWAIRGTEARMGGGLADRLPQRGALGLRVQELVDRGRVELVTGFEIVGVQTHDGRLRLHGRNHALDGLDAVIAATGFRPDHSLARELRLSLDPVTEATAQLGPLIDPNVHSCGTVPPHGVEELAHLDAGYYVVGAKSYGRAPTFLLITGYEQVRSIVAALAGDWETARDVRLVLPETGVCSSTGLPAGRPWPEPDRQGSAGRC